MLRLKTPTRRGLRYSQYYIILSPVFVLGQASSVEEHKKRVIEWEASILQRGKQVGIQRGSINQSEVCRVDVTRLALKRCLVGEHDKERRE